MGSRKREIKLQKFSSLTPAGHKIAVPAEDQSMPRGLDAYHLAGHADSCLSQVDFPNHQCSDFQPILCFQAGDPFFKILIQKFNIKQIKSRAAVAG